ncbi:MAG: tryptophan-rich sensory protein [Clostridiales bacterium]|nr:tryptophan-rich sensory protein [Clostridiales bacterium]
MQTKLKAWLNLVIYLVMVAINTLGAFGYINGLSQKQVSDRYDTLITPSPFAFSIWAVLYTLMLITLVYWLVKHRNGQTARVVDEISPLFWLSSVMNIAWVVAFSYELIGLSTLFILALAASLALISQRLKAHGGMAVRLGGLTFGLYGGWILIATFVNVAAFLVKQGWDGFGIAPATWAIIVLAAAVLITLLIQGRLRNAALTLPIAWAYFAIWHRHTAQGTYQGQYPLVGTVAVIGAVAALAVAVLVFVKNQRCVLPLANEQKG